MDDVTLTKNGTLRLNYGEFFSGSGGNNPPVLQVIDLKRMARAPLTGGTPWWYRVVLSDGSFSRRGVFCAPDPNLVDSGKLQKGSIISFLMFLGNFGPPNRRFFAFHGIGLKILKETSELIGHPVPAPVDDDGKPVALPKEKDDDDDVCLTEGGIITLGCCDTFYPQQQKIKPVLQVTSLKPTKASSLPNSEFKFYWIVVSDGSLTRHGLFFTNKCHLLDSGKLQKGSIVRFTRFSGAVVADRRPFVVHQLEILRDKYELIGNPIPAPDDFQRKAIAAEPKDAGAEDVIMKDVCLTKGGIHGKADAEDASGLHI